MSTISSASELLHVQSKLLADFLMQVARLWLTKKTFFMTFSILEQYLYNNKYIFQQLNSISTITRLFLLDICTILNTCLVFSIQQLLVRKYKKASQSSPTLERLGVKVMGRGILAVGLHVDFQSLQR